MLKYSYISDSAECTVLSSASDSVELLDIDLLLKRGRSTDLIELLWLPGRRERERVVRVVEVRESVKKTRRSNTTQCRMQCHVNTVQLSLTQLN